MKAMIRPTYDHGVTYDSLAFACPGCAEMYGGDGLHMLPVNSSAVSPAWSWDGNLDEPTLSPSILTRYPHPDGERVCHSFLRAGVFEFLADCTHSLAGQHVPMPDLPD